MTQLKTKKAKKAKKLGFWARFEIEQRRIHAHSLAQFWAWNEPLPDDDAHDRETYYKVLLDRMNSYQRRLLVEEMWRLTQKNVKFFTPGVCVMERRRVIAGVIRRFAQLREAADYAGIDMLGLG